MVIFRSKGLSAIAALVLASYLVSCGAAAAQGTSRTFAETGKTVSGIFLVYWNNHGGLAQQGYPISDQLQQVSPLDGKTYTVQYFERAVFEEHPEFAGTSNEVLLSLLGVFRYNELYPYGEPGQVTSTASNAQDFPQTGHTVGGVFLDYWKRHGGLLQQGYPTTDEFNEVSPLDGRTYRVQYFERAVFEEHPEYAGTPNEVLLSQLGTFAWQARQTAPTSSPTPASTAPTATPQVTATLPPESTQMPTPTAVACDTTGTVRGTGVPVSGGAGAAFQFTGFGFLSHEDVTFWITRPDGSDLGRRAPIAGGATTDGVIGPVEFTPTDADIASGTGRWAAHFRGDISLRQSIIYFCLSK